MEILTSLWSAQYHCWLNYTTARDQIKSVKLMAEQETNCCKGEILHVV